MNNLRNKVQLIGHIGKDPEVKEFEAGKKCSGEIRKSLIGLKKG